MLEAGPETLLFIAMWSTVILFSTPPSLNKRQGLIANDLVIVPSSFSVELQYY